MRNCALVVGIVIIVAGLVCIAALARASSNALLLAFLGLALVLVGIALAFRRTIIEKLDVFHVASIVFAKPELEPSAPVRRRALPAETKRHREEYARHHPPPAFDAPAFNVLTDTPDLSSVPGADPMTPMYMLDKNFRILDWNEAFSLAFDHTMEGRRGQGALEWVYFLDNFEAVLKHGRETFADPDRLPRFNKEEIVYTSITYGTITATKRAYQFPDDNGAYAGWLIILDVRFHDPGQPEKFQFDLTKTLWRTLVWSEYALSYDQVLMKSGSYQELLARILGEDGRLTPIRDGARVLDLGAGTGNVTVRLARQGRIVFALDNNRAMLNALRAKCQAEGVALRRNDGGPGVIVIKQDANSLFGLSDNYFDYVIANNVLYSLDDPQACLEQIRRVLRPGGEVRLSGPSKGFNLDKVFRRIKSELTSSGQFGRLQHHFDQARRINYLLEPTSRKWSERNLDELLAGAGFHDVTGNDSYYHGHGRIVCARRPPGPR